MTTSGSPRRPSVAARRVGYLVAVVVNGVLLYAANGWPGWDVLPFLTADTALVMGAVNASIVTNLGVNVVYLVRDDPWLRSLGDLATIAVGLVALLRVWQVFPLDFGTGGFDWSVVARVLLGVGIAGSVLGIVVAVVGFVRNLGAGGRARPAAR